MAKAIKHVGFKGAVKSVMAKQGVSKESANKIIGYDKAHANAAAKAKNPSLKKTGGRKK